MAKTRMYEPYGYDDGTNYISKKDQIERELETNRINDCKEFASVEYNASKQAFVFKNVKGQERGYAYMADIIPQELIENAYYDSVTKNLVITFVNGKVVNIPLEDLIDVAEAGDGLKLEDNKFYINLTQDCERFLTVSSNGLKLSGVQDAINVERDRAISAETDEYNRAAQAENELSARLTQETSNRVDGDTLIRTIIGTDFTTEPSKTVSFQFDSLSEKTQKEIDDRTTAVEQEAQLREIGDNSLGVRVDGLVNDKANKSDVYTKAESDARYMPSSGSTSSFATKEWVQSQGYLTEHQDISNLATKEEVQSVDDKVDAIDLSPYAKTDDVNAELQLKADKTEIPTDFYTQEEVNGLISQLLTRIENLEENDGVVVADDAETVENAQPNSNIVLTSTNAIQALTSNTEYNTITIVGGNANNGDIKAIASEKLTMDGVTINGDKGASNGRILISANTVTIKNATIESGSTAYNVFEGSQNTAKGEYFTKEYTVSNMNVDNTMLNHNILNIYTLDNDAVVTVKDSYFNLDVDNSNVLRLANYTNATGITVNFENVNWTYENAAASDWSWAGLIIYQPSSTDVALNGDTSKIATWKFNFINCKYNGALVDAVNYGQHNQVIYGYNINKSGEVSDISSIVMTRFA